MTNPYFLGIDIGTTSAKAVAFSMSGQVLISCVEFYEMMHPLPGYSEQDPVEIFDAVVKSCNRVASAMDHSAPAFLAFSAAMHSILAVDQYGKPLTNCIIWADNRAAQIAEQLHTNGKAFWYYARTGVPVHAMSPLCKIMWWQKHQPAIFREAYRFIGIKEFVFLQLTGQYLVDSSVASATGLLNIETLQWDDDILDGLGIGQSLLSRVVPPTYVTHFQPRPGNELLTNFLIPAGTPLVIGGSDGAMANLASASPGDDTLVVTIGTSSAARLAVNKAEIDDNMRTFCYHQKNGQYIIGGPGNNGAVVLEWLKEKLLTTTDSFNSLFSKAEKIDPGSEQLLFLPYLLGERAPIWNSNARGVFFGLGINHTQSHLVRASMEGVIFGLYSVVKLLMQKKQVKGIQATGGFAQSSLWLQMLADVCNTDVAVSTAGEASALGAVMIGIEALKFAPIPAAPFVANYKPSVAAHMMYMQCFEKFEQLYRALEHMWATPNLQPEEILV